jgi:hypothetical protein
MPFVPLACSGLFYTGFIAAVIKHRAVGGHDSAVTGL